MVSLILISRVKIGDFNISKVLSSSKYLAEPLGTAQYQAPEVWTANDTQYTFSVDMWGLGCTAYELCTLDLFINKIIKPDTHKPYPDIHLMSSIYAAVKEGLYPTVPVRSSPTADGMIYPLLPHYIACVFISLSLSLSPILLFIPIRVYIYLYISLYLYHQSRSIILPS